MIMIFERISTQYSRFEYMEYDQLIRQLNSIPKEKRNKAKYVFTSHPNQANSIDQLKCIEEIFKALEENDLDYLEYSMNFLSDANSKREFKQPSYLEESTAYHIICLPNLISSFSTMYELGLKDLEDFFEIPGTWMTFEFDNHPEMQLGLMTFTHGLNIQTTINQYLQIINEADVVKELSEIIELFEKVKNYAEKLMKLSEQHRGGEINKTDFYLAIPITNISGIESKIIKLLKNLINNTTLDQKVHEISKKLTSLLGVFKLTGCLGQIRLSGQDLKIEPEEDGTFKFEKLKPIILDVFKEISVLNTNIIAVDMILFDYENQNQYNLLQSLLKKYRLTGVEIVPLISSYSVSNETKSNITMLANSESRKREGLLLTELRNLREYKKNPEKFIFAGQGNTAERGGGPYNLTHQKYKSLTKVQRQRHIRTIQGFYFTAEFSSKDIIFTFLLNGGIYLNVGDHFEPSEGYLDFLFELDTILGVPQRELQKTPEFSDLYTKNPIIKTMVESFSYGGSKEIHIPFENMTQQKAITRAYVFSDRCSFTHPELAYWDRLDEQLIKKIAKYYYDNNRHFKYVLYNYAFMIKRFDIEFAKAEIGLDENNPALQAMTKGRNELVKILENVGLGANSTPIIQIYNQHLGLLTNSSAEETQQKFNAYRMVFTLQNYYVRKYLRDQQIGNHRDADEAKYKLQILQSALANISTYNGKG